MNMNEFNELCQRYFIAPSIALENDRIVSLLIDIRDASCDNARNGYRNLLIATLEEDF